MSAEQEPHDAGRRRRRGAERGDPVEKSPPPAQPVSSFPPLELVSKDELESIHQAALTVLKEIGIDFLHDGARATLKDAGADVDPASRAGAVRSRPRRSAGRARAEAIHPARAQPRAQSDRRRAVTSLSVPSPAPPTPSIAPAADGPATIATTRTSFGSGSRSIRFISGAAIRSSRSTSTLPSAISTRSSTC